MKTGFHKDKTDFYVKALMAATVLLGVLTFLRVAGFLAASSEARVMAARMDPNTREAYAAGAANEWLASAKASAEELKKKNLFVKTPPKQHPISEVLGILGDEALINGKWCKVGDAIGEAKVVAIEPTKVRIAWDGQEKEFSPIGATGSGPAGRPGPARGGGRAASGGEAPVVVTSAGGGGRPGRIGAGLSDAERDRIQKQWQSMSPEDRQRAREEARQRLGARPR